jgi:bidirectional [NiFe] hydrogenase diaphorase subunit
MTVKTLKIDDKDVASPPGQPLWMQAAREAGVPIPTLCHLEGLSPVGACRLCLVEVAGVNKLLPACVTEVRKAW